MVSIGHGVGEIAEVIREYTSRLPYVHSSQFHTSVAIELAEFLSARFPGAPQSVRVHFTSGGSEATETAIKIVRQYWLARKEPQRYKILFRAQGYHGATLGVNGICSTLHEALERGVRPCRDRVELMTAPRKQLSCGRNQLKMTTERTAAKQDLPGPGPTRRSRIDFEGESCLVRSP